MTRAKIDYLLPTVPESVLMLDDPPEGVRPKWLAPGTLGQVLQIDALGRLAWGPVPGAGDANPMTTQGDMIYGIDEGVPVRLPIGLDGEVLGIIGDRPAWRTSAASVITAPGDLVMGGPAAQPIRLPAGTAAQVLGIAAGVPAWITPASGGMANPMTGAGDLIRGGASGLPTRLAPGADGLYLSLVGGLPVWSALPAFPPDVGFANPMTAMGDLIRGGTSGVATRLAAGTDGHVLTLAAGVPGWALPAAGGMTNPMTTLGDLILGGASGAPTRLGIGAEARVLQVSAGAVTWQPLPSGMTNPMTLAGDLIIGGGPAADPAFVNAITAGASINNGNLFLAITVGAGGNYLLYIAGTTSYGPSFTNTLNSVTAARTGGGAGLTFTPIVNGVYKDVGKKLYIWGSPCAAGAEYTLTANWTGNVDIIHAVSAFSGVNAGTPYGTPATDLDGGAAGSVMVAAGTNGLLVDAMVDNFASTFTPGAGQTALYAAVALGGSGMRSSSKLGSGSVAMTMTTTSGGGSAAYAAVALLPGTAYAPGTPIRLEIGSTGQVLTTVGGTPAWATPTTPPSAAAGLTAGRMVFVGAGPVLDDDASLTWDDTGKWMKLGTTTALRLMTTAPTALVAGVIQLGPLLSSGKAVIRIVDEIGSKYTIGSDTAAVAQLRLEEPTGSGSSIMLQVEEFSASILTGGDLNFVIGGTYRWIMESGGHLRPAADSAYDLGVAATNRVRSLYALRTVEAIVTVAYSTSVTIDSSLGSHFVINVNNATAFTINAPTNPTTGHVMVITIRNTHTGAHGTITWNAIFKKAALVAIATATSRTIAFRYNGTNWVELWKTPADVPN